MVQLQNPSLRAAAQVPPSYRALYPTAAQPRSDGIAGTDRVPEPLPVAGGPRVATTRAMLPLPHEARGARRLQTIDEGSMARSAPQLPSSSILQARQEAAWRLQQHARAMQHLAEQMAGWARSPEVLEGLWMSDTLDDSYSALLDHHRALVLAFSGVQDPAALSDGQRACWAPIKSIMEQLQTCVSAQRQLRTYGYLFNELAHCCAPLAVRDAA